MPQSYTTRFLYIHLSEPSPYTTERLAVRSWCFQRQVLGFVSWHAGPTNEDDLALASVASDYYPRLQHAVKLGLYTAVSKVKGSLTHCVCRRRGVCSDLSVDHSVGGHPGHWRTYSLFSREPRNASESAQTLN